MSDEIKNVNESEVTEEVVEVVKTAEVPEKDGLSPEVKKEIKKQKKDSASAAAKKRRLRIGATATALTIAVIVGLVLLNVVVSIIAAKFPMRTDLSAEKLFSLSDESVELAKSVDKDIEIVVFAAEDTFTAPENVTETKEIQTVLREFYRALEQYRTYSGQHVSYKFVDLDLNPTSEYLKYEVKSYDILFLSRGTGENGTDVYRTATIDDIYSYEQDLSGNYTYVSRVERTLGSKINSVIINKEPVVQVLVGHGENEENSFGGAVIEGLKSVYELNGFVFEELNLQTANEFNERAIISLIAAPQIDYTEEEIDRIADWLDNDGKLEHNLLVFTDPTAACENLYSYLNVEWGIEVTDNLVFETDLNRLYSYDGRVTYGDVASTDLSYGLDGEANVLFPYTRVLKSNISDDNSQGMYNPYHQRIVSFPASAKMLPNDAESTNDAVEVSDTMYGMVAAVKYGYDDDNNGIDSTVTVCGSAYSAISTFLKNGTLENEDLYLNYAKTVARVDTQLNITIKQLSTDTVQFTAGTALLVGMGIFTIGLPAIVLITALIVFLKRRHL